MADKGKDNPASASRRSFIGTLGRYGASAALGFAFGRNSNESSPPPPQSVIAEKSPEIPKPAKEHDLTTTELALPLDRDSACVVGFSGYGELWDPQGRIGFPADFSRTGLDYVVKPGVVRDFAGKPLFTDLPENTADPRLSPDGTTALFTINGEKRQKYRLAPAERIVDPPPFASIAIARPHTPEGEMAGIRFPEDAQTAFDSEGRIFVYTTHQRPNFWEKSDNASAFTAINPYVVVYPQIRIYDLSKPILQTASAEAGLEPAINPKADMNKRFARLLSGGETNTFEGIMLQKGESREPFAVSPDGKYVCVPVKETFYWKGKGGVESSDKGGGMKNVLILRLDIGDIERPDERQRMFSTATTESVQGKVGSVVFYTSLIRISASEYPHLSRNAESVSVLGATKEGNFLVGFDSPEDQDRNRNTTIGLVTPQIGGVFEIRYVHIPGKVSGVKRMIDGVHPNFRPENEKYSGIPFLSNDQLSQLGKLPPWKSYDLIDGSFREDVSVATPVKPEDRPPAPLPTPAAPPPLPTSPGRVRPDTII